MAYPQSCAELLDAEVWFACPKDPASWGEIQIDHDADSTMNVHEKAYFWVLTGFVTSIANTETFRIVQNTLDFVLVVFWLYCLWSLARTHRWQASKLESSPWRAEVTWRWQNFARRSEKCTRWWEQIRTRRSYCSVLEPLIFARCLEVAVSMAQLRWRDIRDWICICFARAWLQLAAV